MNIGERAGAIHCADKNTVYLYGFGTYQGEEVPPNGPLHEAEIKSPKILLDNGNIVWGYACWWSSEAQIKEMIGNRKIVMFEFED